MPFTPFHMGPGIAFKALLGSGFSLMVFGWTQIVMDLQPLLVILTGEGHLHGFSHTFIGATLLALLAAVTGKLLVPLGFRLMRITPDNGLQIHWLVGFVSAFIGSFSHVYLDAIMHVDLEPFYPWTPTNPFLGLISGAALHRACLYSGLLGAGVYYGLLWRKKYSAAKSQK